MFYHHDINGADLPCGELSLTYDDGPGVHTVELSRYLQEEDIRATFFVVGERVLQFPAALESMHAHGHLIGNHTYSHRGLVDLLSAEGDAAKELAETDRLIRPYVGPVVYFRPPYGSWRPQATDRAESSTLSRTAELLNRSRRFADYLGPIMWDVTGGDWGCWERNESVDACLARYLEEIQNAQRGIVLLHDSSETPEFARRNQTFELTKRLVPELKRRGFRFVSLDAVPSVRRLQRLAGATRLAP